MNATIVTNFIDGKPTVESISNPNYNVFFISASISFASKFDNSILQQFFLNLLLWSSRVFFKVNTLFAFINKQLKL